MLTKDTFYEWLDEYYDSRGLAVFDEDVGSTAQDPDALVFPFGTIFKDPAQDARPPGGSGDNPAGTLWADPEWNGSLRKLLFVRANAVRVALGKALMSSFSSFPDEDQLDIAQYVWFNRAHYDLSDAEAEELLRL